MGQVSILLLESEDISWFRSEPGAARGAAAALARRVGLDERRSGEVALAVSEAASNLVKHAVDGAILLRVVRTEHQAGVEFLAVDSGPGMADVPEAMRDGMSSAGTLGIGLGSVARLADVFDVHSLPGRGTVIAARFWATRSTGQQREPSVAGLTRAISGEQVCGDAWAARIDEGSGPAALLMLCDGLGHGPMAALAAAAAVQAFRSGRARQPADVLDEIHRALRGTRGAAVAVARVEPDAGRLLYCGVGNVAAALIGDDTRSSPLSHPGIVGHRMPQLRTFEYPLPPGGALVMHSDGLTDRWDPDSMPGLLRHLPVVVAGHLLRQAGVRRDDAGVLVAKGMW
ncbi:MULTISPECIES: ATP-binding SpoIIE family protein phosphatase [Streptacidiphilus]|uniref:SpoIIE family protein phosphatase n=1 Tax=Streptacidiphilus cavernicola TaxID=3342716 RepID=A0ABV6UJF7_9ACTN|nr:ATP-binding SpoIIE family protein phosphatase [Streptacidiphilus jeojiense]